MVFDCIFSIVCDFNVFFKLAQDKVAVCVQASEARSEKMRTALSNLQCIRARVQAENETLRAAIAC
jgi:hypothetical protein